VITDIKPEDVPWVLSLAHQRYHSFDPGGALVALTSAMHELSAIAWRTPHAFLVATIVRPLWNPNRPECHVLALCAEAGHHWEAARLLRQSREWAIDKQCARWWFWSETEHRIGALAERVGAKLGAERYLIDFMEG